VQSLPLSRTVRVHLVQMMRGLSTHHTTRHRDAVRDVDTQRAAASTTLTTRHTPCASQQH
jgi:hypothetical protein